MEVIPLCHLQKGTIIINYLLKEINEIISQLLIETIQTPTTISLPQKTMDTQPILLKKINKQIQSKVIMETTITKTASKK
jgi:hypothetical protein